MAEGRGDKINLNKPTPQNFQNKSNFHNFPYPSLSNNQFQNMNHATQIPLNSQISMFNFPGVYGLPSYYANVGNVSPRPSRSSYSARMQLGSATQSVPISDNSLSTPIDISEDGLDNIDINDQQNDDARNKRELWTIDEDKVLAKAWVTISVDGKIGKNQKDGQFWKRIVDYFNQYNKIGSVRSVDQAKSRWHRANEDLNEFNEIYNRIHNEYHSGWSDDQLKEATIEEWNRVKKRKFQLMHMWSIINENAKWNAAKEGEEHSGAKRSSSCMEEQTSVSRPTGTKAAKAMKKDKGKVDREQLQTKFNKQFTMYKEIQQEKIQVMKELSERLKGRSMTEDIALMNTDTSNYTEEAKAVHLKMCAEIKAKWNV